MQTWSVGVLCYNEGETLEKVVAGVRLVLQQLTNTFEIVIVDDKIGVTLTEVIAQEKDYR